jgi:hypothetical protein
LLGCRGCWGAGVAGVPGLGGFVALGVRPPVPFWRPRRLPGAVCVCCVSGGQLSNESTLACASVSQCHMSLLSSRHATRGWRLLPDLR